ncbi:cytochrome-c oxidase [Paenibacillus motobuensis]|uniref:cytochrome-c oxidase n=1 Tax=Paenibacillus TaxID=44249 RepID=UPI00204082D9|nr:MULTISPECIES: cytochrome-c oxidase [Paenibacillus]MCM3041110.1 cytochrome-c oxidase [Paenibacillus lutimineralis]MCM3648214.1 cytochrome-c oxidase [Paenibacillus motobuensis]
MGIAYIKVALVYFVIGVGLGVYMSMAHDYTLTGVHVHINLLGWASFALAGVIYWLFPKAGNNLLSKIQFWVHTISLPVMMICLTLLLKGNDQVEVFMGVGSTLVVVSVIIFAINVFLNVGTKAGRR